MERELVFIVEDDQMLSKIMARMLEKSEANYIIAHNLNDALEIFKNNKANISYILLDGILTKALERGGLPEVPDTLPLAREIAKTEDFKGLVYPMSVVPTYVKQLLKVLADRGIPLNKDKIDTIKHVIDLIKSKKNSPKR